MDSKEYLEPLNVKCVSTAVMPNIRPPLTNRHKMQRIEWTKRYMKTYFQMVLFTDEGRATFDGPEKCWLVVPRIQ